MTSGGGGLYRCSDLSDLNVIFMNFGDYILFCHLYYFNKVHWLLEIESR